MGFKQSTSDPCVYTSTSDGLFVLAVYVADILLAGGRYRRTGKLHEYVFSTVTDSFHELNIHDWAGPRVHQIECLYSSSRVQVNQR